MNTVEMQQGARQIKELLRLSKLLRVEHSLNEVLSQVVATIANSTGFRVLVINLIREQSVCPVAFAGVSEEDQRILQSGRDAVDDLMRFLRPEFRMSESYFISHKHADLFTSITTVNPMPPDHYRPGGWHPDDTLLVPLYSTREQKMLGFLSFDDPIDGKIPTQEQIEILELFANQLAIAVDNALVFQEREHERLALEESILRLRENIEQVKRGDLRKRMRTTHPDLQPVVEVMNSVIEEISSILGSMQTVALAVDEHARRVQRNSELLARDTHQQGQQIYQISSAVNEIVTMMSRISESASLLSKTTAEATDVTLEAQGAVDRAVDGMGKVREATMQSGHTMKMLSESGQEINDTILLISELTIRMHHLALNAAIEATRAGEYGQGFAVVAQEIRTLAVNGGEAARKIAAYIRTIQHEMTAVSQSVEQSTQQVVMQTELVTQTGVALEAISMITEHLTNLIQGVCTTADNQSLSAQHVVDTMKEILHITEGTTQHMGGMQQSLDHLIELTNALRSRMALLRIDEH
jgi:methyl-accepting chemotaxis protein